MAGITTVPFKLFHHHTTPSPLLNSSHSKLFGLSLSSPNSLKYDPSLSTSLFYVSARYGGGSRSFGSGDSRRRQTEPDDDEALDLSTLRSGTVRLIDQNQNMVGVLSIDDAIKMAEDVELDLVILSPEADPPVVRIMNYRYDLCISREKKLCISSIKMLMVDVASRMDLKELKMGYNIDEHDYSVRLRAAQKFLKDGDKVKVIVNLKGRENEFRNMAIELITRFQNDVGEVGLEEVKNFRDRNIFIILVPNKAAAQKTQEPPKKKDKTAKDEVSASVQA
ncbi:hypothetical protein ACSQ67_006711 [Phaseolus vulgaris]